MQPYVISDCPWGGCPSQRVDMMGGYPNKKMDKYSRMFAQAPSRVGNYGPRQTWYAQTGIYENPIGTRNPWNPRIPYMLDKMGPDNCYGTSYGQGYRCGTMNQP
jgi:hypothetical protein